MTAIVNLQPIPFESNEHYLGWEMLRLQQRLNTYIHAKENPDAVQGYHQLARDMLASRPAAIQARESAVESGVDIPFHGLSARFGLSAAEEEVLMSTLAPHLSSTNWHLLVFAQGSVLKTYLEVGFVAEVIQPSSNLLTSRAWCEQSSALLKNGLLVIEPPPEGGSPVSLLAHAVYAPHYVAAAVTGVHEMDERLAPFCEVIRPESELYDVILSDFTRYQVEEFLRGFFRRDAPMQVGSRAWTLLIDGPRRCGKTTLAQAIASSFGKTLFALHLDRLERRTEAGALIRLAARNAQFLGSVLLLSQPEQLLTVDPSALGTITSVIAEYTGLTILEPHESARLPATFETLIDFPIDIERTDAMQREHLWESLMPDDLQLAPDADLGSIATAYGLTGGQIQSAIEWARQRAETRGAKDLLTQSDLVAGAKSQVRSKLGTYTEASKVQLTLVDLILPPDPMTLVNELLAACRNRKTVMNEWGFGQRLTTGKGLVALFTGEPGTGKTLCAEILANELDLRLHIVSIPKVVSKWVGETEKNIREIFTHARAQNSMLLFDEADSLFASRVRVEKSQDHFQNMEVNMLLQEIERFEGIVLLTTNLEANLDRAFERRILFKIDFPAPERAQREEIWKVLIPAQAPTPDDIDWDYLAETFELTGGQIKNAIIRAAYRACEQGTALTLAQLEDAARQQAREAGKLTREW